MVLTAHYPLLPFLTDCGWAGVDLFFVLSGFLVSGQFFIFQKDGHAFSPGQFLLRRGFRIWPAFYTFLLWWMLTDLIRKLSGGVFHFGWEDWLIKASFLQNYFGTEADHTWSLAVEEHFYIILALSLPFVWRIGKTFSLGFAIFLMVVIAITRSVHAFNWEYSALTHHYPTHFRLDSLVAGVILRGLVVFYPDKMLALARSLASPFLVFALILLGITLQWEMKSPWMQGPGFTLLTMGFTLLVWVGWAMSEKKESSTNLIFIGLGKLGTMSFTVYLFHFWILKEVMVPLHHTLNISPQPFLFPVFFTLSLVLGYLVRKWIELPFLTWRDKLLKP